MLKINEIDNYSNIQNDIGGCCCKKFVRVNSEYLQEFFEAKKDSNCSYRSYLDDFLDEENGEYPFQYVSVLFKASRPNIIFDEFDNHWEYKMEEFASRFANSLGIETVYNRQIGYDGKKYIMSMDFIKPDEQLFETIHDDDSFLGLVKSFEEWEDVLDEQLTIYIGNGERQDRIKDNIKKQFIGQYFLKKYMLRDVDFKLKNVAFIRNAKTKDYRLAPAFDLEFSLMGMGFNDVYYKTALKDFDRLLSKYPDETNKIMTNISKYFDDNNEFRLDKLTEIAKAVTNDPLDLQCIQDRIKENISIIYSAYREVIKNREFIDNPSR